MTRGLRRPVALAVLLAVLGALVVGSIATVLSLREYPIYEARLQVRLLADPEVGDEVALRETGEAVNFIATELVTLNSAELRDDVREARGMPDLSVSAVQIGNSNVVEIVTRSSQPAVVSAAEAVASRYVQRRRTELLDRIEGVGGEVERQLRAAAAEITRLGPDDSITAQVQRGALTTEYTRLIEQRNTLQVASDASSRLVQVVNAARSRGVSQIVSPLRNGVLGALVGAVLGLALALLLSRLRNRVGGLEDLLELAPDVALPTLPHLTDGPLATAAGAATAGYVSALTGPDGRFGCPPLVVVAPTPGAGATVLAVGMAVASARRRPTVLLAAGDVLDGAAARLLGVDLEAARTDGAAGIPTAYENLLYHPAVREARVDGVSALEHRIAGGLLGQVTRGGAAVVVDAPALSTSGAALELARESGQVLLVGGIDVTSAAEMHAASRSVQRVGAQLAGLVLTQPLGGLRSWRRR